MTLPPDLHKAAQAAHIALTCISTHPTLDISDYLRRRVDAAAAGLESALSAVPAQPVAWIDKHGNIEHGLDAMLTPNEWFTPLYAAPQAVPVPAGWVDSVMEQAQVFASAWSLVGGKFDNGSMLEEAQAAKAELRAMLAAAPKEQP